MSQEDEKTEAMLKLELAMLEYELLRPKYSDDHVCLDDTTMMEAISRRRPLKRNQLNALLDSPRTLHRFKFLANLHARREALVANDPLWGGAEFVLRAAAAEDDAELTVSSESQGWTLKAQRTPDDQWELVFSVSDEVIQDAHALLQPGQGVVLTDHLGQILARGTLDEEYEMRCPWVLPDSPRAFLAQPGRRLIAWPDRPQDESGAAGQAPVTQEP